MKPWRRCPGSSFYKQLSSRDYYDKRLQSIDAAYVDPVDLVLVRTLPWREDQVQVLMWQLRDINEKAFFDMEDEQSDLLSSWSQRVARDMQAGPAAKAVLIEDLDVDPHSRDLLLDAIELLVNLSPPQDTYLKQLKIPRKGDFLKGALLFFGIKAC